jgi:hypothetical protein
MSQRSLEAQRLSLCESSFLGDLLTELATARERHPKLNSIHEAYAVLLEEVDELWDEVRKKKADRAHAALRSELLQIAAMAWRTAIDLDLGERA